jgi:Tol biopolymer transport system component
MSSKQIIRNIAIFIIALLIYIPAHSQYFGRNKPSYKTFNYQLYQSPNFDFYHYFDNDSIINALANTYEKWFIRHQQIFKDTFEVRNPIILYANHPDFQQTSAVGGTISIGTQGVTEALRNRVVMPVLETNAQTDHVIGHELVHVFQFRAMFVHDTLGLNSIRNLPLWLVEGMAEYFSIGSVDAHTAMIMRDAYYNDDFPSLEDMTRNYKYNPYRYGHSFVAFVGRTWGDSLIGPLFRQTARLGYERGMERVVGLPGKTVSNMWKHAIENHYKPLAADSSRHIPIGDAIITSKNGGKLNISPAYSPDGKYVAFYSEKDLFTIDLFIADAEKGKIRRKLTSSLRNADIDGFNFFESVGTWSPDGKKFAYIIVKKGINQIVITHLNRWKRDKHIKVDGIASLNNPAWSPDGKHMIFNGLKEGIPDLFLLEIETGEVTNLTNDRYSYIHSKWSADGKMITFATDKPQSNQSEKNNNFLFNLALMDLSTKEVQVLDIFPDAQNVNPVFSPDDKGIYFLSNSDGYRNLYYYEFEPNEVYRLTDYYTGISGITHLSPAITIAKETGNIAYSYYSKGEYHIYDANPQDFTKVKVDPLHTDFKAATLPPGDRPNVPIIDSNLLVEPGESIFPKDSFNILEYKPKFSLTYIGNTGVGMSTSRYGTGMSGGVAMLFSDIVGDNQLFTMLSINGEIYDFGGIIGYTNQKRKINWGGSVSHIPYVFGGIRWIQDEVEIDGEIVPVENLQYIIQRTFEDQITVFGIYPISTTRRIELSGSWAWYYYRLDAFNSYYYNDNGFLIYLGENRERLQTPDGFSLQRLGIGYVGDNSYFGLASPMRGQRYRLNAEKYFGRVDMVSLTADYRWYHFFNPVSIAFRATHYGRWLIDEKKDDLFYPLFLGYPGFVRGYEYSAIYERNQGSGSANFFEQYIGDRVILGGFEIRLPLTGPERLAIIKSGFLFTELAWFVDAGIAWSDGQSITFDPTKHDPKEVGSLYRTPVFSTGPSLRINLLGAIIIEPFYAFPFTLNEFNTKNGTWGLNFIPGW